MKGRLELQGKERFKRNVCKQSQEISNSTAILPAKHEVPDRRNENVYSHYEIKKTVKGCKAKDCIGRKPSNDA